MAAPSWLTEDVVKTAASNPVVQNVAKNVAKEAANDFAKNPEPYMTQAYGNQPGWVDAEKGRGPLEPAPVASVSEPGAGLTEDELKDIKRAHLILRILYMAIAILMFAAAVLTLGGASFTGFFIAGYVFAFSTLVCCFELGLGSVARGIAINFGFMYSMFGRIMFILFLAVMCYSLNTLFGQIDMGILVAILAIHLYIIFRYPKYSEYVRKTHYFAMKTN